MAQRTLTQNKSLHLDCKLIADALNEAGIGMKAAFEIKNMDVQFSAVTVKECLWKPLQEAMYGKKSTVDLTTGEVSKVHDALLQVLGEKLGLPYVDFPDANSPPFLWAEMELERKAGKDTGQE